MTSISKLQGRTTVRGRLLAGAATAVLASALPAAAQAQQSTYNNGVLTAQGNEVAETPQANFAPVTATDSGSVIGIDTGFQNGVTNVVQNNTIDAIANANLLTHTIDLALIGVSLSGEGIASLAVQGNVGTATSEADGNVIQIRVDGFQTGSATNTGNRILATTAVNTSSTDLSGSVPAGFSSTTPGAAAVIDVGGSETTSSVGSIMATTVQRNFAAGSSASVDGNRVRVSVDPTGVVGAMTSTATLDDNEVAADYAGNSATSRIAIEDGSASSFTGAAAIANDQENTGANAATSASNNDTRIRGRIAQAGATTSTFAGSLSVSGNSVTASASGNSSVGEDGEAGNSISLDGGMTYTGPGGAPLVSTAASSAAGTAAGANADLVITSSQRNTGTGVLRAATVGARVTGNVQSAVGASVSVSDNLVESSSSGNAASSAITNEAGAASVDGSMAIVNLQANSSAGSTADTRDSVVRVLVGEATTNGLVTDSSVSVNGNDVRALARGNSSAQAIDLEGVDVPLGTAASSITAGGALGDAVVQNGGATITNVQTNAASPVSASNVSSRLFIEADPADPGPGAANVVGSQLQIAGNVQEGVGIGNTTGNLLSLSGNSVGTGVGLANQQSNDAGSPVTATFQGDATITATTIVDSSTLSASGNLQRALAYGNSADNEVAVDANLVSIDEDAAAPAAASIGLVAALNAGYNLYSGQTQAGDVTATANGAVSIDVGARFRDGSTANISGNALAAAAYANESSNDLSLDVNNLSVTGDGHANVAALSNAQATLGSVAATVATGGAPYSVTIGEDVRNSTVSVSGNSVQALAFGNRALGNNMSVTGTNITSAPGTGDPARGSVSNVPGALEADAAFAVQNVQVNIGDAVTASVTGASVAGDAEVRIADQIRFSSVTVSGNSASASANANSASSSLELEAANLSTTAALQNFQSSTADVTADAGSEATGSGGMVIGGGGQVLDSSLTVSGNTRSASATGNNSTSSLDVAAANITGAGNNAQATADSDSVEADYTIGSSQNVTGAAIGATAYGNYGMGLLGDTDVTSSSLTVAGNSQTASAIANRGVNSLSLTAANMSNDEEPRAGVNSALLSVQRGDDVDITSSSVGGFYSPAEVLDSSVSITGNSIIALGVVNDVENELVVAASNLEGFNGASGAEAEVVAGGEPTVSADHVVNNVQTASGSLDSNAFLVAGNLDAGAEGVTDSALTISGNTTASEATANRAVNSASIGGAANNEATAAVVNYQDSDTAVSATALTTAGFTVSGDASPAALNSGIALNGNTTTALARGNASVNSLTYTGGTLGAQAPAGSATLNGGTLTATGSAVVLNAQNNSGPVTATATNVSYAVALNGVGQPSATNSSVSVSGNAVNATAIGNSAVNTLSMTGLNMAGVTGSVANSQVNSGNITATASGQVTIAAGSPVTGSTFAVGGNSISATAVGNSAATTITNGGNP